MQVVIPLVLKKELVKATNVVEPSDNDPELVWDAETFYEKSITVRQDSEIWTAKFQNIDISPKTQTRGFWESQGFVNKYAFLSGKQKTYFSNLSYDLVDPGIEWGIASECDVFGFFGLEGGTLNVSWRNSDNEQVRDEAVSLVESLNARPPGTVHFVSGYHRLRNVVFSFDEPIILNMHFDISGSGGLTSLGSFCAGKAVYSGMTQLGSDIRMTQYMPARRSSNGLMSRDAGRSAIKHSLTVTCQSDDLDKIMDLYDGLAGIPTLYRMTRGFAYHWIYGTWTGFSFLYSNDELSYYNVDIESVTYPDRLPDGYDMPSPC